MVKRELTLRERRRIYEDAICIVAQANKMSADEVMSKERAIRNLIDKQLDRCMSILMTTLNYHEAVEEANGIKRVMLYPEDNDSNYAIEKSKFESLLRQLPDNKELRESLWKSFVKRDKKATATFASVVA